MESTCTVECDRAVFLSKVQKLSTICLSPFVCLFVHRWRCFWVLALATSSITDMHMQIPVQSPAFDFHVHRCTHTSRKEVAQKCGNLIFDFFKWSFILKFLFVCFAFVRGGSVCFRYLFYVDDSFGCMYVCVACVCVGPGKSEESVKFLETGVQMFMSHQVGAGKFIWVLWKDMFLTLESAL